MHGQGGAYVSIGLETDPAAVRAQNAQRGRSSRGSCANPSALSHGNGRGPSHADWEFVADLGQYEIDVNPDCGDIDSNPFGVLASRAA